MQTSGFLSDFLTASDVLLAEVAENDFLIMMAGQVLPEGVIIAIVITTDANWMA